MGHMSSPSCYGNKHNSRSSASDGAGCCGKCPSMGGPADTASAAETQQTPQTQMWPLSAAAQRVAYFFSEHCTSALVTFCHTNPLPQ